MEIVMTHPSSDGITFTGNGWYVYFSSTMNARTSEGFSPFTFIVTSILELVLRGIRMLGSVSWGMPVSTLRRDNRIPDEVLSALVAAAT